LKDAKSTATNTKLKTLNLKRKSKVEVLQMYNILILITKKISKKLNRIVKIAELFTIRNI